MMVHRKCSIVRENLVRFLRSDPCQSVKIVPISPQSSISIIVLRCTSEIDVDSEGVYIPHVLRHRKTLVIFPRVSFDVSHHRCDISHVDKSVVIISPRHKSGRRTLFCASPFTSHDDGKVTLRRYDKFCGHLTLRPEGKAAPHNLRVRDNLQNRTKKPRPWLPIFTTGR